jgi:Carboxymuconolactone decarboxylase family.
MANTMELFAQEAPEVAAAFNNLIMAVVKRPALDAKTKQLIYIAMKAAIGRRYGQSKPTSRWQRRHARPATK